MLTVFGKEGIMTIQRAITVLKEYNDWRRHEGEPCACKYSGLEIGVAIDVAILYLWKMEKVIDIIDFSHVVHE